MSSSSCDRHECLALFQMHDAAASLDWVPIIRCSVLGGKHSSVWRSCILVTHSTSITCLSKAQCCGTPFPAHLAHEVRARQAPITVVLQQEAGTCCWKSKKHTTALRSHTDKKQMKTTTWLLPRSSNSKALQCSFHHRTVPALTAQFLDMLWLLASFSAQLVPQSR